MDQCTGMQEMAGHSRREITANKPSKPKNKADKVIVKLTSEKGKFKTENKDMAIVKVITDQGVCQASGNLVEGIEVNL